ncbi:MAG: DEAD/DEAH box helicase [Actinomycetota bacterium]
MKFRAVTEAASVPADPEAVFDELPRVTSVPELWRQQSDVLRLYARQFEAKHDVAIELPTGTGKTLVGLLIADWKRRKYGKRVLFACPTVQLADQVFKAAEKQSIPVSLLSGSHTQWQMEDVARYEAAEAIGVVTYSSIFNSAPKVGSVGSIILDDAHAGEQYVGKCYSIQVERRDAIWASLLDVLKPALDGVFFQRLQESSPSAAVHSMVKLIAPSRHEGMEQALDKALAKLEWGTPAAFSFSLLRPGISSCLVYLSWNQIYIRPFISPTMDNAVFDGADQRIYLSATLGAAGELERAFGRTSISRLHLPSRVAQPSTPGESQPTPEEMQTAGEPRSGRRLFLFPKLAEPGELDVVDEVLCRSGKALILAPTNEEAEEAAEYLRPEGWNILGSAKILESLQAFSEGHHVLLPLAGRYDGLDLADDACRLLIIDGLPSRTHLQEKFLAEKLRASAALAERIRTRIVQGAGRATRGPADHAIVLIRSEDVTRYLCQRDTRESLGLEMQAEIAFGLRNSTGATASDIVEAAEVFLEHGKEWRQGAEPLLLQARRKMERKLPEGTAQLGRAAEHEVTAAAMAWRHDYANASKEAGQAAAALSGVESLRSYRSFWFYLAFVWAEAAAARGEQSLSIAQAYYQQAEKASSRTSWLRETDRGTLDLPEAAIDTPAVRGVSEMLLTKKRRQIDRQIEEMLAGLAETDHRKVEPALTHLGQLLGARAWKPKQHGRCDSAWVWDGALWITVEAKTEHRADGEFPLADVRKVMTQLSSLEKDLGVKRPLGSISVAVSPKIAISSDTAAAAHHDMYLVQPADLEALGIRVQAAWEDLYAKTSGLTGTELEKAVRRILADYQVLPTHVSEDFRKIPMST